MRLAGNLRIHRAQALGHLQYLWWWALDYAPTGDVSALTPAEISAASEWHGDQILFQESLKECGWLDQDGHIHDWMEYAGRLVEERRRDAERKRLSRLASARHPADGGRTAPVPNPTQPNRTQPNPTKKEKTPPLIPPGGEPPGKTPAVEVPPGPPANGTSTPKALTNVQRVVMGFKIALGATLDDKAWDRVYFRRYSKAAAELLSLLENDVGRVADCIEAISQAMEKKSLSWTPETIVKHAGDWKNGRLMK